MNPAIAKVILVHESFESAQLQIAESHVRGIDADHAAAVTIDRVFAALDLKPVQMLIVPTESDLQYLVELSHRTVATQEKASPNHRAYTAQHSPHLIDLFFMTISLRHGISLRWCTAHPQLPATLPEAEEQLAKLYRYIADHASPEIAQRYTSAIIDYCDGMQTVPHRGTCRDDVRPGLRVTHYRGRAIILRRGSLTLLPRSRLAAMRHQRFSTGIGRNSQNASVTGRASAAPERTALYTSRAPHGGSSGRPALL